MRTAHDYTILWITDSNKSRERGTSSAYLRRSTPLTIFKTRYS